MRFLVAILFALAPGCSAPDTTRQPHSHFIGSVTAAPGDVVFLEDVVVLPEGLAQNQLLSIERAGQTVALARVWVINSVSVIAEITQRFPDLAVCPGDHVFTR